MNILVISDLFTIGGNTTYLLNVIGHLKKNGHTVTLISFVSRTDTHAVNQFNVPRYDIFMPDFQFRYLPFRCYRLFILLTGWSRIPRPDIVLSDLCLPAGAYALCRLVIPSLRRIPFLYQFHGSNALEKLSGAAYRQDEKSRTANAVSALRIRMLLTFETWVLRSATIIFVFSTYSKKLLRQLGVTERIIINPPGCEDIFTNTYHTVTKREARNQCGLSDRKKVILILSRLEPRKGIMQFLDSLEDHRAALKTYQIVLCSQFDSYFGMETLRLHGAHAFGSSVHLVNNPSQRNKALLYRSADVVVIPSQELETFGFVALEAYASGTPVVAYNVGALREIIPSMYLVNRVGDISGIISGIKKITSFTKKELRQLSTELIARSKKYSWTAYMQTFISSVSGTS